MSLPEILRGVPDAADPASASAILTVDLDAVAANYRHIRSISGGAEVAGVVKANAYGTGLAPVALTLAREGCRSFFVADPDEGAALRAALPGAAIYVTNGLMPGAAADYRAHALRPCLGSFAELDEWRREASLAGRPLAAALHFDTGLSRLGFNAQETERLTGDPALAAGIGAMLVMSHLACSDEPDHPLNAVQLARFRQIRATFPAIPASFANTAGLLLGAEYGFDMVRPGYGLYGGIPVAGRPNPFLPAIRLEGRVLQIREVPAGSTAGYGATWKAEGPRRLAVIAIGYADGYFRSLASTKGAGRVHLGGHYAPVAGRVSMDLLIVDLTGLPEDAVRRGDLAELIGPHVTLDEVADRAGTIGYEVLTRLGDRTRRHYTSGPPGVPES